MARLHLKYKREHFDERFLMLSDRFINEIGAWRHDRAMKDRLYFTWLHGASAIYNLPTPTLFVPDPYAPHGTPGNYLLGTEGPTVYLARHSVVSMFHQFHHHMEACWTEGDWVHQSGDQAQAWACSLFYQTNKKAFRRAVRTATVAGVTPADLLKTAA